MRVAARVENGMVELEVTDNGIGISDQDLPKLGNPFVQADNPTIVAMRAPALASRSSRGWRACMAAVS